MPAHSATQSPDKPAAKTSQNTPSSCCSASQEKEERCFHCHEPIAVHARVSANVCGELRAFCCHGCQAAAEFIERQELGDFYRRREFSRIDGDKRSVRNLASNWSFLDDPLLAEPFLQLVEDVGASNGSARHITLRVQGMYCNSCSWLIKQAMEKLSDSISCAIEVDQQRVDLLVSDDEVSLAEALQQITELGYQVNPLRVDQLDQDVEQHRQRSRQALQRIAVAGFGMMQVMTYAVAVYFGQFDNMQPGLRQFLELISMLVATGVVFYAGAPFFNNAINDLAHRRLGMDVPIALAIGGAYFPSVWEVLVRDSGFVYFDSAVMFIFFLSVGRYVEMRARQRFASTPLDLQSALPHYVEVERGAGEATHTLTLEPKEIKAGDRVWLQAGQLVVADGEIIDGQGVFDEASLTGESIPLDKHCGDRVIAGTRLLRGHLQVHVHNDFADSYLARIDQLLRRASMRDGEDRAMVEQTVRHFVAGVLLLTAVVAATWWFIAPERVFQIVLAMLVASCPCAFALARPIGLTAASAALRQRGILLADFSALERLSNVDCWAFDKTGTLTIGQPQISEIVTSADLSSARCLEIAGALEAHSQHVLAVAFADAGNTEMASAVQDFPGLGVQGQVGGQIYRLGKRSWINAAPQTDAATDHGAVLSEVVLADDQRELAVFLIRDELRSEAVAALTELAASGADIEVWSGDRSRVVEQVMGGLPVDRVIGDLLPDQKLAQMRDRQARGQVVAMVGDGLNDAPVMAQADVAVAMVQGAEISQSQAQLVLLGGKLTSLPGALKIARRTNTLEKQNLRWALAYNLLVLPLAAAGYLAPWLAALGMSASSLLVVLNALRVGRTPDKQPETSPPAPGSDRVLSQGRAG